MPAVNVNIQPEIISWALSQTQEEKLGDKLMNNITQWLNGTKTPTFNQIEDFSKKANIPLGYFFLQTPPVEQIELLEYRTVDSIQLANPSRNLIDTIHKASPHSSTPPASSSIFLSIISLSLDIYGVLVQDPHA